MTYRPQDLRKKRESWRYFFSFERNAKLYTYSFLGICTLMLFSKPIFDTGASLISSGQLEKERNYKRILQEKRVLESVHGDS